MENKKPVNQSISSEYSTIGEVSIFAHDNMTDFEKFLMAQSFIVYLKKELDASSGQISEINNNLQKKFKEELAKKNVIINELEQKNNKLMALTPSERKNLKKEEIVNTLTNQLDDARATITKLKKEKDELLCTVVQLRK